MDALKESTTKPETARLLVVDDDESVALTISEVLRREGFSVDTAASGSEAAPLLRAATYDLVLTDLHMANGDGLSVLAEVRRLSPLSVTIVLTGFASVESAITALRHGAYDYLIKPCIIEELKLTVGRGLEHRRLMLAEQSARSALEALNLDLEQRVRDRTAELQRLNAELSEANRAKDVFLATLSHELRTPLTPVLGWVNLLRAGQRLDPALTAQGLDAIERNARLQARLVDDLLDISRIVTGKLRLDLEVVDLRAVVEAAVETVRGAATERTVEIELKLPSAPLVASGAPVRLQQIIWNLVTNAVKFSPEGGRVVVQLARDGDEARLVVADNGIGIDPEFLPHVFERFRQADGSTTRRHGGLGLGLAIVHALAAMHGGRVSAESAGTGHGARFTLWLPCPVAADDARAEPATDTTFDQSLPPVLIVEDSPETLDMLRLFFSRKGYTVMTAASAAEAEQQAARQPPGIIISDIGMPQVNGYELLARLRRMPGLENVPAIALSGYAMEEDRQRALAAGFNIHLAKPINPEDLFVIVRQFIETGINVETPKFKA